MTVTPELLAAYADGKLGAADRARVEAAVTADPEMAEALVYLQRRAKPQVIELATVRRTREAPAKVKAGANAKPAQAGAVKLPKWAPLAACLLLGLAIGFFAASRESAGLIGTGFKAQGPLAAALDRQLAADRPGGVRIGQSFRTAQGGYCRSFDAPGRGVAGLACREGDAWQVRVAAPSQPGQPVSALSPPVIAAVQALMAGGPLDAATERAARDKGWR